VQALPAGRQESKNRDKQLAFIVRVMISYLFKQLYNSYLQAYN
jgi:hypothetical protein